jgi:hypothetical protein
LAELTLQLADAGLTSVTAGGPISRPKARISNVTSAGVEKQAQNVKRSCLVSAARSGINIHLYALL